MEKKWFVTGWLMLLFCLSGQEVFAKKGCFNLVVDKKQVDNSYSLVFTVKNVGEDVIFEDADLLPWQTNREIFFSRLTSASDSDLELKSVDDPIETEAIVALFPRDTMTREVSLADRYPEAVEKLQAGDLVFVWSYKPHPECVPQDGMVLLMKLQGKEKQ